MVPLALGVVVAVSAIAIAPASAHAQRARHAQPDPAVTYAVPLDDSPSDGPRHAKVTIVVGMEFACPFCRRSWDTLGELRRTYGRDLRIVYKAFIVHQDLATSLALAACAADKAGKWHAMAERLWTHAFDRHDFSRENVLAIGRAVGIDPGALAADMHDPRCAAALLRDMTELTRLGQDGTPTFWINGRFLAGAQPIDRFTALIDEELGKANDAIRGGVRLEDYYDGLLKTGLVEPR
jgi:protein-disulfide isomerase